MKKNGPQKVLGKESNSVFSLIGNREHCTLSSLAGGTFQERPTKEIIFFSGFKEFGSTQHIIK